MQISGSHSRIPVLLVKHRNVDLHFLTSRQSPGHFKKHPSRVIIVHDVLEMRRNSVWTEGSYWRVNSDWFRLNQRIQTEEWGGELGNEAGQPDLRETAKSSRNLGKPWKWDPGKLQIPRIPLRAAWGSSLYSCNFLSVHSTKAGRQKNIGPSWQLSPWQLIYHLGSQFFLCKMRTIIPMCLIFCNKKTDLSPFGWLLHTIHM